MNPRYTRNDLISLEYGKLAAQRLRGNPALMSFAIANIQRWNEQQGGLAPPYREWQEIIAKGLAGVLETLESDSDDAQRLRSSTPFVGDAFVTQEERGEILQCYPA